VTASGLASRAFAVGLLFGSLGFAQERELRPYVRPPGAGYDWENREGSSKIYYARGPYVHDGFYMRAAGGFGGGSDRLKGVGRFSGGSASRLKGSVGGFTGATHLALGGTPFRGLVLGGSLDTLTLIGAGGSPSEMPTRYEFDTSQLAVAGIFADYYPFPTRGFHAQASFGLAIHVMGQGDPADVEAGIASPHSALGYGFTLGAGNEWWVHEDWSIGLLPRLMLGWASGTDEWGTPYDHRVLGYSLLVTMTYH